MAARLEQLAGGYWAVICDGQTQEDSRKEAEQVFMNWQRHLNLKALFARHGIAIHPHSELKKE